MCRVLRLVFYWQNLVGSRDTAWLADDQTERGGPREKEKDGHANKTTRGAVCQHENYPPWWEGTELSLSLANLIYITVP